MAQLQLRRALTVTILASITGLLIWNPASALLPKAAPDRVNSPPVNVTCSRSGCHNPAAASCPGKVEVLGVPSCYIPGQAYEFEIKVTDPNAQRWGFEIGVQYNTGGASDTTTAGTLANVAGERTAAVTSGTGTRTFITHDRDSPNGDGTYATQANSASWKAKWTAPAGNSQICVYVAGVAADNGDDRQGDCTYTNKYCLPACEATPSHKSSWGGLKIRYGR
jgi:hypothetical protein